MPERNATLFYRAAFQIDSSPEAIESYGDKTDLVWQLVQSIRRWCLDKTARQEFSVSEDLHTWSMFRNGCTIYSDEESNFKHFFAKSYCFKTDHDEEHWACEISEQVEEDNHAGRKWVSEYGIHVTDRYHAQFSCIISYTDFPGFIGRLQEPPAPSTPRVVRLMLQDHLLVCHAGSQRLFELPQKLEAENCDDFKNMVMDPMRECPIVYISPQMRLGDNDASFPIPPADISELVVANAITVYSHTHEFRECWPLPQQYSYKGGTIRVFLPHLDPENPEDYRKHRFITHRDIEALSKEEVLEILRRALAQDIRYRESGKYITLETCERLMEHDNNLKRLEELREKRQQIAQKQKALDETEEALDDLSNEQISERNKLINIIDDLELSNEMLQIELDEKSSRIHDLENRISGTEGFYARNAQRAAAMDSIREITEYPSSQRQIGEYFEKVFQDRLAFTERGKRSLDDCNTDPKVLWSALYLAANDLYDAYSGNVSDIEDYIKSRSTFGFALHEGRSTNRNPELTRLRDDVYQDRIINITPHIKSGSRENDSQFIRVYLNFDQETQKIIIGYCGKHLENASSRRVR